MSTSASFSVSNFTAIPGASSSAKTAVVNVSRLVFSTDLVISILLIIFIIWRSPRFLARIIRPSEWKYGFTLRSVRHPRRPTPLHLSSSNMPRSPSRAHAQEPTTIPTSEELHTVDSHTHLLQLRQAHQHRRGRVVYPRAWRSTLLPVPHWVTAALRHRVAEGFSVGQALVLAVYTAVLVYPTFYKSNLFVDPVREGFVAMSQIPVVFAFAAKNGVVGMLLGMGYERLNFFHRFVGRLLVLSINIHAIGYIYQWTLTGTFTEHIITPSNTWGFVGLVCVDFIFIFSTSFWRRHAYNIFFTTHIIGFILLLPAVCFHKPIITPYVLVSLGIYGLDHVMRLLKTRVCTATIRPLPELGMTRVEIPSLNGGWRAGQHVRVRVLSGAMGWWGWTEAHPFTIADGGRSGEGMVLMCKNQDATVVPGRGARTWTGRLYELAKSGGYGHGFAEKGTESEGRTVRVVVEGPYGGTGHAIVAAHSAAVIVCGGSGITWGLSVVQELVRRDMGVDGGRGRSGGEGSRVKIVELVWCIQDPASLAPLLPLFTALVQTSSITPVKISVFYTRASAVAPAPYLVPGITLAAGRPKMVKIMEAAISRTVALGSPKDGEGNRGMIVGVCGPAALGDECVGAVRQVEGRRRRAVGGIEVFEEVFGV